MSENERGKGARRESAFEVSCSVSRFIFPLRPSPDVEENDKNQLTRQLLRSLSRYIQLQMSSHDPLNLESGDDLGADGVSLLPHEDEKRIKKGQRRILLLSFSSFPFPERRVKEDERGRGRGRGGEEEGRVGRREQGKRKERRLTKANPDPLTTQFHNSLNSGSSFVISLSSKA